MRKLKYDTTLEIHSKNLISNLNYFRSQLLPTTKIMGMVKAYGYGLGPFGVAKLLEENGVNYLGVANILEGVELRKAGIKLPIMIMKPELESFDLIIEHKLSPVIFSFYSFRSLLKALKKHPKKIDSFQINIKIDTGMHRLGFSPNEIPELLLALKKAPQIKVEGVFSHLAASDEKNHDDFTKLQIIRFKEVISKMEKTIHYRFDNHILNSNGALRFPEAQFDMVRLGIGLYGFVSESKHTKHIKNVAVLKTKIAQLKTIPKGDSIGYGRKGKATKQLTIATVPLGYADGISRSIGNGNWKVKLHNKFAPTIGTVCMDMCMIDVTGIECKEDDEIYFFYNQDSTKQLSSVLQTIPYEILSSISPRVKRVFI